jgi:hypothetical protein
MQAKTVALGGTVEAKHHNAQAGRVGAICRLTAGCGTKRALP